MKFEDYMKQKKIKMREEDKLLVFSKIQNRTQKQSIFSKIYFYTKVSIYSLFVFFVIFSLFIKKEYIKYQSKDLIVKNNINTVNAGYVGKVIKSEGEFTIIDKNKKINNNIIRKGDIITLGVNSNIHLKVNKGIKLYLIGPAKLRLNYYTNDEGIKIYTLDMLDGSYISVVSNSHSDKILLKSSILNIESNDSLVDIKYEKRGNAVIVENNGGSILVKNKKNIIALSKKEKLIIGEDNLNKIKNILNDNYKKYKLDKNGEIKTILSSNKLKKLGNMLERNRVIISIGKYVLGSLNKDDRWKTDGKEQLINIISDIYSLLGIKKPPLIESKLKQNKDISIQELELLVDNLLNEINKKYILPEQYEKRLKVILAYLIIIEKAKIKKGVYFKNLSSLVNYLKLDNKYKKILLQF